MLGLTTAIIITSFVGNYGANRVTTASFVQTPEFWFLGYVSVDLIKKHTEAKTEDCANKESPIFEQCALIFTAIGSDQHLIPIIYNGKVYRGRAGNWMNSVVAEFETLDGAFVSHATSTKSKSLSLETD